MRDLVLGRSRRPLMVRSSGAIVHVRGLVHRISPLVRLAPASAEKVWLTVACAAESSVSFCTLTLVGEHRAARRAVGCHESRGADEPEPASHSSRVSRLHSAADESSQANGLSDADEFGRGLDELPFGGRRWS